MVSGRHGGPGGLVFLVAELCFEAAPALDQDFPEALGLEHFDICRRQGDPQFAREGFCCDSDRQLGVWDARYQKGKSSKG